MKCEVVIDWDGTVLFIKSGCKTQIIIWNYIVCTIIFRLKFFENKKKTKICENEKKVNMKFTHQNLFFVFENV